MDNTYFSKLQQRANGFRGMLDISNLVISTIIPFVHIKFEILRSISSETLRKKCLYAELFSPNVGKCGAE